MFNFSCFIFKIKIGFIAITALKTDGIILMFLVKADGAYYH